MDASNYARDTRRALFSAIPALGVLKGGDRYRAEDAIEQEVERAIRDYLDDWMADAEGVP